MSFEHAFEETKPNDGAESSDSRSDIDASQIFPASDFSGLTVPPREWLVQDLIPARTVTILNGDGGTGKSLVALQLAVSVATGLPWFGVAIEKSSAVFITAEDDRDELHRRIASITIGSEIEVSELSSLYLRSLAGEDALLAIPAPPANVLSATALFRLIETWVEEHRPKLVVLDTLADLFGGNEIDRSQARQFIGLLRGLAIKQETTVLLLAHPSLSGMNSGSGSSGSTAWNNSVRSRLYLRRVYENEGQSKWEPDANARIMETMKANYGRTGGQIHLLWDNGVFVVEDKPEHYFSKVAADSRVDRIFLELADAYDAEGRRANHTTSSTYAPKLFADDPRAEGIKKRAFKDAMNRLLASKVLIIEEDGPPSKRRSKLVRA